MSAIKVPMPVARALSVALGAMALACTSCEPHRRGDPVREGAPHAAELLLDEAGEDTAFARRAAEADPRRRVELPPGSRIVDIPARSAAGRKFRVRCAPGFSAEEVWGTGTYSHRSHVCTAAVHDGRIARQDGGEVLIELHPGQAAYTGSTRRGITSRSSGNGPVSFVFVES